MRESGSERAYGRREDSLSDDSEPIEVLYVDDESQTDAVMRFVDSEYDRLRVVGETSREAARERVTGGSFDCLVVELKFATAINDVSGDTPLILFTETDPTAISDDLLEQVDTLVQKGAETHVDFLVDKVFGLVDADEGEEVEMERVAASVPDARTEFFLLDDEGHVEWASAPVEEFFPDAVAESPTDGSLHERLRRAATDEYRYTTELAEAVATGATARRVGLSIPRAGPPTETDAVTYSCWSYPLPNRDGRLESYRNVTAAIAQGQRLDKLEELVELARDGLYMLDADARYSFVTDRYAELLGYEREELLGRHASSVMSKGALEDGQRAVESLLRDPSKTSTVLDQVHQSKSGAKLQLSIHFTVVTDENGAYDGLMGVARDVTERREREQELAEYKTVFETVFDRVYVLDGDGTIRLANEPFASLVGATVEEIQGTPAESVFGADGYREIQEVVDSIRQSPKRHGGTELTVTDESGNEIPCKTDLARLPDDRDGGCVGVIRDISERVQREQQVAVLDRVLRHNLRNELTVVLGRAELLAETTDDPRQRDMLETIQQRCNRLMDFAEKARRAQRVLDHALTKQLNAVAVRDIVDRVATRIGKAHPEARLVVDVADGVTASVPRTVTIAVTDLAKNAVEHNHSDHPLVDITVSEGNGAVEISVADDGPGIPQNELDVLMNGTQTPLKHGSGIGFWLVHWIVSQCGGELHVEERSPGGSVVTMTLPDERSRRSDT